MTSNLELRWLEDFIALAKLRNFTRAAYARNVTQPQFSRRIRQLEQEIGVELVDRSESPLSLTPAGECFLNYAKNLLLSYAKIRESCQCISPSSETLKR